ncbi:MAG: sigma-54-dependent Fis family transcriptional regulator [Acidobacteria bacterium]|nr:sigma-54-dependent Fis family transcriptional regulator [Acidobacteriota bacterium]
MSRVQTASTALLAAGASAEPAVTAVLRELGFDTVHVDGKDSISDFDEPIALCLVDLRDNGDALRIARAVRSRYPEAIVIGVADPGRPHAAAEAIRAGVFDVLPRPPTARDLRALIANAREQASLAASAPSLRAVESPSYGVVGTSAAMRPVMELVQRAAAGQCGIMICGERGSGREMIARAIHAHSVHRDAPFVAMDCSAPEPEDVELQLFGVLVKRGSNAPERRSLERVRHHSRLHEASGGFLFLENVAEMSARAQARLVRVLRDREVFNEEVRERVSLPVRVVASADGSINTALEEGRLRPDLYERLSLIRIDVPALRQRREDIPVLATHFLKELCLANGAPLKTLTRPALTLLAALPWRGNAPELKGLLERLILLVPQGLIRLEDVLAHTPLEGSPGPIRLDATLRQARARFETEYIAAVLQHHRGRIADAARVLGVQRTNLYRKMRRLNLMRPRTWA